MKVLVVDDSGIIRCSIVRVLRSLGVKKIVESDNGESAWGLFQAGDFDMVITDWHMPRMDGVELTKNIRSVQPDCPVFMVTVVDTKPMIVEALKSGVSDFLCKPFERSELLAKLDRHLPYIPS